MSGVGPKCVKCRELFEFHESIFGPNKVNIITYGYFLKPMDTCNATTQQ